MAGHSVTLALLPLDNLSGSAEDGLLAKGFVQDPITELARFPALGVIAADSVFAAGLSGKDLVLLGRRLRAEYVLTELRRATGLGARTRKAGGAAERARTAVTWRIRHAIRKIAAAHPALGSHLTHSIRTGAFCAYEPEHPAVWKL